MAYTPGPGTGNTADSGLAFVLKACGCSVCLCFAVASVMLTVAYRITRPRIAGGDSRAPVTAQRFLQDVRSHAFSAAWDLMAPSLQRRFTRDGLPVLEADEERRHGPLVNWRLVDADEDVDGSNDSIHLHYRLSYRGADIPLAMSLAGSTSRRLSLPVTGFAINAGS